MSDESSPPKQDNNSLQQPPPETSNLSPAKQLFLKQCEVMLQDPQIARIFQKLVEKTKLSNERPVHYKKASNLPYYRESHARWIQKTIDAVITSKSERILLYAHFPRQSAATLRAMCYQAWDFLVDNLDTEDKLYARTKSSIMFSKEPQGIICKWCDSEAPTVVGEIVTFSGAANTKLKDSVDDFIRNGEQGKKFERDNLQLSDAEVEYFNRLVDGLKGIILNVTLTSIKVIKLTDEQIKLMEEMS